jgi:hypothetical protein
MKALSSVNSDPQEGLSSKLSTITGFFSESLSHPDVRALAEDLSFNAKGSLDIEGFFSKLKSLVHYLPDPVGVELIKSPWVMVSEIHAKGYAVGDCDDFASLAYTLLHSAGIEAALYVAWKAGEENPFHIFDGVPGKSGGYVPFDLVTKKYGDTLPGIARVQAYA